MDAIAHLVSQTLAARSPMPTVPISERGPEIARMRDEGLTYRDIADRMGLTLGTVQMTAARQANEEDERDAQARIKDLADTHGQEIVNLRNAGLTLKDLARMFDATPQQIKKAWDQAKARLT